MSSKYILRIDTDREKYNDINSILAIAPTSTTAFWELSIGIKSKQYIGAIAYFMDLVEKNIEKLNQNGVKNEDLSIWYLYEYDEQCNMEFQPSDLSRMGNNGIVLCVSCWQK